MITTKNLVVSWLVLIILTTTSVYLDRFIANKTVFILIVMLIVVIKNQQVTDIFMELYWAPQKWRFLLLSYVVLIPSIIAIIYTA